MEKLTFKKYKFKDYIYEGLESISFYEPTEVQDSVIPLALKGENIIGKSQTGTGKTHSFLLPILQSIDETLDEVQAVIIVPTRELAFQLYDETIKLTKFSESPIDVRTFIGGTNRDAEIKRLEKSQPQIVIGTIGKIQDLVVKENILKIHTAKIVAIDEADMVFEITEMEEVDKVFVKFDEEVQKLIFSATISNELVHFLNKYLSKNEVIDLTKKELSKNTIEHIFIPTKNKDKLSLLVDLLNGIHPYLALIFANTTEKVDEIAEYLSGEGLKVGKLTGKLQARERKQVLKRIKDGMYQYVVCSDIASRGIDITGVSHVVNFELPNDIEFYVHRTGRTARFSNTGFAITFYDYDDDSYINKLEEKKLKCVYKALKDGVLVDTKERNAREKRDRRIDSFEESLHTKIPLGKKVKPGYKKKRKEEIKKQVRKYKQGKIKEAIRKEMRAKRESLDR